MDYKLQYTLAQLKKCRNKSFESYSINRIVNKIDRTDIKFVCQQYVQRPEGRALTDLYFPQIGVHVEIDEGHHLTQIESDKLREEDIINATSHKILRIPTTENGKVKSIEKLNESIDETINSIIKDIKMLEDSGDFVPWQGNENTTQYWIDKGSISIKDDCALNTIVDVANCFGLNYKPKSIWTAGVKLLDGQTKVWCPKLYPNVDWHNEEISDDIIIERCLNEDKRSKHIESIINGNYHKRIIFARVKDNLGLLKYRFKGIFELDVNETNKQSQLVWKKISNFVLTSGNLECQEK